MHRNGGRRTCEFLIIAEKGKTGLTRRAEASILYPTSEQRCRFAARAPQRLGAPFFHCCKGRRHGFGQFSLGPPGAVPEYETEVTRASEGVSGALALSGRTWSSGPGPLERLHPRRRYVIEPAASAAGKLEEVMIMKKKILGLALTAALALTLAGCGASGGSSGSGTAAGGTSGSGSGSASSGEGAAEKAMYDGEVILGSSTWVGYAPLYLADQMGFFDECGADVTVQVFENKNDSRSSLAAGRIQGMSTTIDTHVMSAASGVDLTMVLVEDTSSGGDGLIVRNEITSVEELAGKTVGLDTSGGASYFWFQYLLNQHNMTLDDVVAVNMSSGDAGAAFVAGELDAAATWEPWLSNARETDFGTVLIDSSETPGVIVDALAMDRGFAESYPGTVEAICQGWYMALAYMETNPDEAYDIMKDFTGNETGEELQATMEAEVTFYDQAGNIDYFENEIADITKMASDLWLDNGLIESEPDLDLMIDGSFLGTLD